MVTMIKEISPASTDMVLKMVRHGESLLERTPLHIAFGEGPDFAPAELATDKNDPASFNAIGSQNSYEPHRFGSDKLHLPVIDVDGGVALQTVKTGSKAILTACHRNGEYTSDSLLRDVLGDHGIDLEVFQRSSVRPSMFGATAIALSQVEAIVLRSKNSGIFEAVDSTSEGHGHLYIQEAFGTSDHTTLIQELGKVGIISEAWLGLTEEAGMGIVRTPWTQKEIWQEPS